MKRLNRIRWMLGALLLTLVLAGCGSFSALTATTMRLIKTQGDVEVTNEKGEQTVRENMKLLSGTEICTGKESMAGIGLDEVKAVTLSEDTEAEVTKHNKELELSLLEGEIFFKVMEPLESDEDFDIRTSSMTIGIRGTSGYVKVIDENSSQLVLTSGKVKVKSHGEKVMLEAGQKLTVVVVGKTATFEVAPMTTEDLPDFVLDEIHEDEVLSDMIEDALGSGWEETMAATSSGDVTVSEEPQPETESADENGSENDPTENGNTAETYQANLPEGYTAIFPDDSNSAGMWSSLSSVEDNGDGTYTATWSCLSTGTVPAVTREEYDAIQIGSPFPNSLLRLNDQYQDTYYWDNLDEYKCVSIEDGNKYLIWNGYNSLQEAQENSEEIYRLSVADALPDGRIPLYDFSPQDPIRYEPLFGYNLKSYIDYRDYDGVKTIIAEDATIRCLITSGSQEQYADVPFREFYESGLTSPVEGYITYAYHGVVEATNWRGLGSVRPEGNEHGEIIRLTEEKMVYYD